MEASSVPTQHLATAGSQEGSVMHQHDTEKQPLHDSPIPSAAALQHALKDPNIVDWDGPEDPENPMNWSSRQKITAISIVSVLAFLSPLGSTITSPASADIMAEFHSTNATLETFITSVYLLGYVFGPLVLAPLSEMYGRSIVYNACNLAFSTWTVACGLANNLTALIIFRLFAGIAGSAGMTIGAGTIADVIPLEKRGLALMCWVLGPVMGPIVGPLIAGYLSTAAGWRWIFWFTSILAGAVSLMTLLLLRETYAYTILERKTRRLRKETGNESLRSTLDTGRDPKEFFRKSIVRPLKMLFLSPIVTLLALYLATLYGYQYLMFTTIPRVFEGQYSFSQSSVGLVFLGMGAGFLVALVISGLYSDKIVTSLTKRYGGTAKPEYRLPFLFVGALLIPVGLFLYGWSAEARTHWIVPVIGIAITGTAQFLTTMPAIAYLVDTYTVYAASASAATVVARSLLGTLLPLVGNSMYDSLGIGWGTSLLGFISVAFLPMPLVFWKYGERIRNSRFSRVKL